MPMDLAQVEEEINKLHVALEAKGINSRGEQDIFGRKFELPVNAEHKAITCHLGTLCSVSQPHMRTFWAATIGFFCTFFSAFAPSALGIYYKKPPCDGGLGLNKGQLTNAGFLAVSGTIIMRVLAGPMCDTWGARKTFIFLLLIGIPGMILFAFAQGAAAFTVGRLLIGLSLATFVTCQVWCSQFFDRSIVGKANATAGGWGNLGGGVTLLTMPYIMQFFLSITGSNIGTSWRLCMIVPIIMHLSAALFILSGRDLPDGSYKQLEASGAKQKSKGAGNVILLGFTNTNALIMLITYGLCFGVELTMNNKLVPYFTRYYGMHPLVAGPLGACFSLMNLFARAWGGILSDACGKRFGLRGRIWAMWIVQTIEGLFCIFMGLVTLPYDGPDELKYDADPTAWPNVQGVYEVGSTQYVINGTTGANCGTTRAFGSLAPCSSDLVRAPEIGYVNGEARPFPVPAGDLIMIKDPSPNCVHNQETLLTTFVMMIFFSLAVQMAEGLHFGVVPYISRPALGVVSGMVGAGGNAGAVFSGLVVIGTKDPMDAGFVRLGLVIMGVSCIMHFIYFPDAGGMLVPKGIGYNPQLYKEKAGQKGADELDFSAAKKVEVSA